MHRRLTERRTGNAITVCQCVLLVCKTANFTAISHNQQVTSNHTDTLMPCRGSAAPVCGCLFFWQFDPPNRLQTHPARARELRPSRGSPAASWLCGAPSFKHCVNRDQFPWHSRLLDSDALLSRSAGAPVKLLQVVKGYALL